MMRSRYVRPEPTTAAPDLRQRWLRRIKYYICERCWLPTKLRCFFCILLFTAALLPAQTAKVIALEPSDAAQAAELHNALVAAQKAVADFDARMEKQYTGCKKGEKGCHTLDVWGAARGIIANSRSAVIYWKDGWENGIEYSEDWRFIVPKSTGSISSGAVIFGASCAPNNCTTIPATGLRYQDNAWITPGNAQ